MGTAKYPAQIRAALKRKQCLWKLCKQHPYDVTISNNYHRLQAECQKLIRDYEIKREENVIKANTIQADSIHLLMTKLPV